MKHEFTLLVVEDSKHCELALRKLRSFCESESIGFEVSVVDVFAHPEEADAAGVVEVPTLIREFPAPPSRIVGSLMERETLSVYLKRGEAADQPGAEEQQR